ncbi:hypothetical protein [Streptomyces aureocirculatus]|uniref:hypothetical protein n=1 Tax=Streptomyces aureocirculatus TaxID=67275 RepID=UPI00068FCD77|nr:hypothetical protein [Streptomyces aureocirculatus]
MLGGAFAASPVARAADGPLGVLTAPPAPPAADKPTVTLSTPQAGAGGSVSVEGEGWRGGALLMVLVCGQAAPGVGVPGGTNSCANSQGRAVTADGDGGFRKKLPVAEPPQPCPCVVHVATVTGTKATADAEFKVAGHPVQPLPERRPGGRLAVLTDTRLDGSSGLLTWFGAPPARKLAFTAGNVGSAPIKDPVFQVGTSHGVFAPQWEEQQWRGTIAPGKKTRIELPVELSAGAHGDYLVSLRFGDKVLAEQPWGVGRPWGVTLFWVLLCLVVPAAVFRVGMVVVDRLRPDRGSGRRTSGRGSGRRSPGRHRTDPLRASTVRRPNLRLPTARLPTARPSTARPSAARLSKLRLPRLRLPQSAVAEGRGTGGRGAERRDAGRGAQASAARPAAPPSSTLPWFSPDTDPGAPAPQLSAPSDQGLNSPTTKGET